MTDVAATVLQLREQEKQILRTLDTQAVNLLQSLSESVEAVGNFEPSDELRELVAKLNTVFTPEEKPARNRRANAAEKKNLFEDILREAREAQEDRTKPWELPYADIRDRLASRGYTPASVSVFFKAELDGLTTAGKTKNKTLVVDADD